MAMLLACSMSFGLLFSGNAFAAENDGTETGTITQAEGADNFNAAADGSLTESDIENISAAATYIREQMTQRKTVITGSFEISDMENMNSVFETIADQIFIPTSKSDEGDYLKQHNSGMSWNYEAAFNGSVTTFSYELQTSYYTTLEQEQEVADKIDEVLAELSLDGLSDYEKAKEIYNYIAINVSYDYEHLGDSSYMLSHTAYAALIQKTAVCQGYASLFYRMAHEAGLSTRFVTGLVDGEAHAWNMVKIGDLYYYVDTTHASSSGNRDDYFLKGSISFADRQLDSDYLSADFTSEFPMSDFDYSDDSGNTEVSSGELTPSIQWYVKSSTDEEGKTTYYLELQGNGEIPGYVQNDELPWEEWRDEITVVTIGSGITKIGSYVFSNMDALTTVQIANTVATLGDGAFYNCGKLTNLQIPGSVTSFGNFVIGGTYGKTQWEYNPVEKKLTVTGDGAMGEPYVEGSTTEKNASRVPWNRYRDQIEKVVIEEGVVNLSTYALHGMTSLTAVTLPSTLEEIGEGSFESCTALTYICIPDSVKTIGHYAFRYCEGLRSIHIPASVTSVGVRAFADCPYLHEFYFYGDAPEFENQAIMDSEYITVYYDGSGWSDVKSLFEYLTFETWEPGEYDDSGTNVSGEGIKSQTSGKYGDDIEWNYDEKSAVLTLSGKGEMGDPITIVTVDETTNTTTTSYSTNAVPWNPFNQQIKEVVISDGITSISRYAFWWLTQIESITIPDSVTTVGQQSFVHCSKLQTVTFGKDLTTIGEEAFKDCTALKEVYISDKLASVEESAFTGCEALTDVYYEGGENAWGDIVIGEDNDPLINAEIHYNYGKKDPWIPDGAFSISKSGAWVSGKECALYGSYSAATPGNAEEEAKEIVWSSSDPSILDVSDTIIDFYIADAENNHVSIQKSFTAKKAGTVTITAIAPDGRSASVTIDVEPELVAVGTEEKITEETEVTLFRAELDESDAEYLEAFISQIEVEIEDALREAFTISNSYYRVAEDGMSAEIVYILKPIWNGSIEFHATSLGGQTCNIVVHNGLWSIADQWSFENYVVDKLPLQDDEYNSIISGLDNSQKKFIDDELVNQTYNGQCYGMAATATLVRQGVLPLSDIDSDLTRLYSANKTDSVKSLIGYYHINQYTDSAIEAVEEFRSLGIEKQLETLITETTPYVLSFGCDSWGGHAVVAWGFETGSWSFHNHTYDTRIRIYDSNYGHFDQDAISSFLYFNSETYEWEIPNYYDVGISSDGNGYLKRACGDSSTLTDDNFASGQVYQEWLTNRKNSPFFCIFDDNRYLVQGENFENTDKYLAYYSEDINISSEGTPLFNVFFKELADYTIEPYSNDQLDMSILYPDYYLSIEANAYDQLKLEHDGAISAIVLGEAYDISVTADDEQCTLPWYTVEILGSNTQEISAEWADNGVLVTGDNLENVTVIGSNDDDTQEMTFSTDEDSVLISESDNDLEILVDTDNDGVYETDVNEKEEHVHEYGVPKFTWSENYTTCIAVFACETGDDEQKIECEVTSETTDPTCTEDGKIVYTATVSFADKEYTDTQEKVISATSHTYEYTDNRDGTHTKACTAGDDTAIESHTYQDGICTYCGAEKTFQPDTPEFTDVHENDWYYDPVQYVSKNKLMTGLNETTFGPIDPLVRAQFAVILHRMNGEPEVPYSARFHDVGAGLWYTNAILWAADTQVVTGYSNGNFGPGDLINREQMALMMYRYANYKGYDTSARADFSSYQDASMVSDFAAEAMQWAVGEKIITGKYNETQLDPKGNASRAECATIIMRFVEKYGK